MAGCFVLLSVACITVKTLAHLKDAGNRQEDADCRPGAGATVESAFGIGGWHGRECLLSQFLFSTRDVINLGLPRSPKSRYSGCLRGSLFEPRSGKDRLMSTDPVRIERRCGQR